ESLLLETPPNVVRRRFSDLASLGKFGGRGVKRGDEGVTRMVKIMTQSVRDFLDERFESEEIKTTLATDGVIGTNGGPATPGTAYILLHHVMGGAAGARGLWGFIRGGMGAISNALARSAESKGVVIRANAEGDRILVKDGKAYGVALKSGEEIHAKIVVSNADPKRTFLSLVESGNLDEEFRRSVKNFRVEGSSFKINLALDGLPNFTAYPNKSDREVSLP